MPARFSFVDFHASVAGGSIRVTRVAKLVFLPLSIFRERERECLDHRYYYTIIIKRRESRIKLRGFLVEFSEKKRSEKKREVGCVDL